MEFKLEKAPAIIRDRITLMGSSTAPQGKNGAPIRVSEVQLTLEINVSSALKSVEALFPTVDMLSKLIAGNESAKGVTLTSGAALPEMAITVACDQSPVLDSKLCALGKPQLKIDSEGEGKLVLHPRLKMDAKKLDEVCGVAMADVVVSLLPAQLDISDIMPLASPEPEAPKKRGKKAATVIFTADPFPDPQAS